MHNADERIDVRDLGFATAFYADSPRPARLTPSLPRAIDAERHRPRRSAGSSPPAAPRTSATTLPRRPSTVRGADRRRERAGDREPERQQRQRAHPVIGADARQRVGGMWRTSAVSHQISNSEKRSPTPNASEITITNGAQSREREVLHRPATASAASRRAAGALGRHRIADQRAEHRADAGDRLEHAEHAGAAVELCARSTGQAYHCE